MIELSGATDGLRGRFDPQRGGTVASLRTSDGRDLLWHVSDDMRAGFSRGPSERESESDWMRHSVGGWEVMAPNAGGAGTLDGVAYPFHGSAGRLPWSVDATTPRDAELHVDLPAFGLRSGRRIRLEGQHCLVEETLGNVGSEPRNVVWGSHLAFGDAMLSGPVELELEGELLGGTVNDVAMDAGELSAWLAAPQDGGRALAFLGAHGDIGRAVVRNRSQRLTAVVTWDAVVFPYLWIWVELSSTKGWPWFSAARALGLEPVSAFPATGIADVAASTATQVVLEPGATLRGWVDVEVTEGEVSEGDVTEAAEPRQRVIAVGSYTAETGGHGAGLTVGTLDESTGAIDLGDPIALPSPSYLAWHPALPVLYATSELNAGEVVAVHVHPDRSVTVGAPVSSRGSHPCHVSVSADGACLAVANYGDGSVAAFALASDGSIGRLLGTISHSDIAEKLDVPIAAGMPGRQDGPHAHHVSVIAEADGSYRVEAVDLGLDLLLVHSLLVHSPTGDGLRYRTSHRLPRQIGPRQWRHSSTGRDFVVGELSAQLLEVRVSDQPGDSLTAIVAHGTSRPEPVDPHAPPQLTTQSPAQLPAHLTLSADGTRAYLSNRGPDVISVFDIAGPDAIRWIADIPVGSAPRHFAVVDDLIVVAGQGDDVLQVYRIDGAGLVALSSIAVGEPTVVAIAPNYRD